MGELDLWFFVRINPQPWAIGPVVVGRKKGGGFYGNIGPNTRLDAYKNAIRSDLERQGVEMITGKVELKFYFWRVIEQYERPGGRKASDHVSDTTNMQKATEDALQGVLIHNDRDVVACSSVIIEQAKAKVEGAEGLVVIHLTSPRDHVNEIPDEVMNKISAVASDPYPGVASQVYVNPEDLF